MIKLINVKNCYFENKTILSFDDVYIYFKITFEQIAVKIYN